MRPPRRECPARRIACALGAGLALVGLAACAPPEPAGPPDVLLVTVDTLRADHTSLLGYERDTTPRLRDFFESGRVFERAYSTEANTSPSVVSILSGLYPQNHRVRLLYQKAPADLRILPDLLRDAGYTTAGVVSNIVLTDEAIGLGNRFDHFDDFVDEREKGWNSFERVAARTTDAALAWLAQQAPDDGPILLWVHYIDPHGPYLPPEDKPADFTHDAPVEIDPKRIHFGHLRHGVRDGLEYVDRYDEEIAYADREIGRLLDAFDALGFADGAITVFTADHGETMMEFAHWFAHGFHVHEPIIHVPLAIRAPGLRPGRVKTPVSLVSVLPTILELAGVPVPEGLDGSSLARAPEPGPVFAEATGGRRMQWRALIEGDEKWVAQVRGDGRPAKRWRVSVDREGEDARSWDEDDPVGALLLEQIRRDPDPAGVPRELEKGIHIKAPKVAPGVDAETLERLRAMGYAE